MAAAQTPTGITELLALDRVLVRQKLAFFKKPKYTVTSPSGEPILFIKVNNDISNVLCCGKGDSAFYIDFFDTQNAEVMRLRRPWSLRQMKVDVIVCGQLVSIVRPELMSFKPVLRINDAADQPMFGIKGSVTFTTAEFNIYTNNKESIGVIRKKLVGFNAMADTDIFEIQFPIDLDVRYKAVIIGTCFLLL